MKEPWKKLEVSSKYKLDEVVPEGTVIVLDQMDHILTDDFSNIILDMATASINQKKYKVIEIGKFINGSCFKDWGTNDLECLHNLAEKAPYPGFLHYCASTFPEGFKHVESKEAAKTKEHTYENRIESFVIRNE